MKGRPRLADYHGTTTGYRNRGCKCDRCLAAHRRAVTDWRIRSRAHQTKVDKDKPVIRQTVPAQPVVDHIAALRATGWTLEAIADESGVSSAAVARIARGERQRVRNATAAAVLAVQPLEPVTVDEVVVDRFIAGDGSWRDLTRDERIEAARRMDAAGVSRARIADRTGLRSETLYAEVYGRVAS